MRTVNDLENMIHGAAKVRIIRYKGQKRTRISAWPKAKVIYLHPDYLDEQMVSDDEARWCLEHKLGNRNDWLYNGLSLITAIGFATTGLAVVGLGFDLWLPEAIYRTVIEAGLAVLFSGITLREFLLCGLLDRRAERFNQQPDA